MSRKMTDGEVGYGRPPTHSQFKPGQSGNPKGRPKKKAGPIEIDLDALVDQPREVRKDGRAVQMSSFEIELRQQLVKAVKHRNLKAILFLLDTFEAHGAIAPPKAEAGPAHIVLPNGLPHDVAVAALAKHGRPPWSRKQLKPIIAQYLETRDEGQKIFDDIVGYDLDV